jgi:tRNA threonylcarbamoyladenosine modification (KEOPS) complex  Pcc1 subunit
MKKASFTITFDSVDDAEIINDSINPEIKHKIPKTKADISISGKKLFLKIEANDISSLRAAINSYLRWIGTALNVKKSLKK